MGITLWPLRPFIRSMSLRLGGNITSLHAASAQDACTKGMRLVCALQVNANMGSWTKMQTPRLAARRSALPTPRNDFRLLSGEGAKCF